MTGPTPMGRRERLHLRERLRLRARRAGDRARDELGGFADRWRRGLHVDPDPRADATPTLFLHLPRTGGTSLRAILRGAFGATATFPTETWADFEACDPTERLGYALFQGHFRKGWERRLGDASRERPQRLLTQVRDPVARVVSHFHHFRLYRNPPPESRIAVELAQRGSLRDFVTDPRPEVRHHTSNLQTWLLSDSACGSPIADERALASAIEGLDTFAYVGLTEDFEESLELLARVLPAAPPLRPVRRNRGGGSREIDREVARLIERRNELDLALYAAARDRHERLRARHGLNGANASGQAS